MARNPVIQVPCDRNLFGKVEAYKAEKGYGSNAEAGRALWEFAFQILEVDSEDNTVSNREILEELVRITKLNLSLSNLIHTQTFDVKNFQGNKSSSAAVREDLKKVVESKVESFLEGKK